jgi:hypothetical protein
VPGVRRDLAIARMGQLVGADGRTYSLRETRIERVEVEALIEDGCPVVTYLPGGRLVWHDEDDAWPAWADARGTHTTGLPDPDRGESVTGGRWESADGAVAVVLVRHH